MGQRIGKAAGLAACLVALIVPGSPAQAGVYSLASTQVVQSAMLLASSAGSCLTLSYDKNGNRVSQSVGGPAPGAALWGARNFGCFDWGQ